MRAIVFRVRDPWSLVGRTKDYGLETTDFPQARGLSRTPAGEALARAAEGANPAEDRAASLAAVGDHALLAEFLERPGCRGAAWLRAELLREPPEERPVSDACSPDAKRPGVRRLVAQRVFPLPRGQVGRDRDAVRGAVDDLSAGQFAAGEANAGGIEPEARRQPVVDRLQPGFFVRFLDLKEEVHRIKIKPAEGREEEKCFEESFRSSSRSPLSTPRRAPRPPGRWFLIRAVRRKFQAISPRPREARRSLPSW